MFKLFKKDNGKQSAVLKQMDGREIKYVTRRDKFPDGNVKETILGKTGRMVVIDNEIRVMCGEKDVFKCMADDAVYYMLLSGDGITISGINSVSGQKEDIIVYYKYHRK